MVQENLLFEFSAFSVVPFDKMSLFSRDLIAFITSLISLFVSVIPELSLCVNL